MKIKSLEILDLDNSINNSVFQESYSTYIFIYSKNKIIYTNNVIIIRC